MEGAVRATQKISWFPGHMYKASKTVKENLKNIDVFLEIRDARIPNSSRNHELDALIQEHNKPKIILFNKYDLCNQSMTGKLIDDLNKLKIYSMPVSAQLGLNIPKIIQKARDMKPAKFSTVGMWMMVGGMPNVGKSTILNKLRNNSNTTADKKKSVTKTGPLPCVTRGVSGFKVNESPLVYVVDTPGIMVPRVIDDDTGMKLALVGCIKDSIVGKDVLVAYMFDFLNRNKINKYIKLYDLPGPINTSQHLIQYIHDKYKHNNMDNTYDFILDHFREGKLGKVTLDEICME